MANAIQRIAQDQQRANLRIIERLDAEMIARAKEFFVLSVPDGKREIACQVINASLAPRCIGLQEQFAVRRARTHLPLGALQLRDQLLARIQPRVAHNPIAFRQAQRLLFVFRFVCGAKERMAHSYGMVHPDVLAIRSAKGKKIGQGLQQPALYWRIVPVHDANETAQSTHPFAHENPAWRPKWGRSRRPSAQSIAPRGWPSRWNAVTKTSGLWFPAGTAFYCRPSPTATAFSKSTRTHG